VKKLIPLFFAAALLAAGVHSQIKTPQPPAKLPSFAASRQMIIVTSADWTSTAATARRYERGGPRARWRMVGDPFPVLLGRSGMGYGSDTGPLPFKRPDDAPSKAEGDGRSPAGAFPITSAFGSVQKPEGVSLPFTKLEPSTECVDDPASSHYNTIVDRFKVGNFDWKSSEKMLDVGEEYGLGMFVGYNSYPVKRSEGSCIFLPCLEGRRDPDQRLHLDVAPQRGNAPFVAGGRENTVSGSAHGSRI
jgi:L,D-peptidoglycan transpeptidase YkuD (ErfK/YbiS/YcfS/YnhG family)